MHPTYARPKVLCIPLDGVAAHTGDAMLEAVRAACESCRLTLDSSRLTLGFPIYALLRTLAEEQCAALLPSEIERASAIFEERYASEIRERGPSLLNARVLALVSTLRAQLPHARIILVSPHLQNLDVIATALGIETYFDGIISAPPVAVVGKSRTKKNAHVYARVADDLRTRPVDCLGIARCPYDIACMRGIGMCAVGIKTGARSSELLGSAGAWRVFISPEMMSIPALIDVFRTGPPPHHPPNDRWAVFRVGKRRT